MGWTTHLTGHLLATRPFVVENVNASEVREITSVQHIALQTVSIIFTWLEKSENQSREMQK